MRFVEYKEKVIEELSRTLDAVPEDKVEKMTEMILSANRIFVNGAGRSGFIMRCFAMRLMHLGLRAFFLGESVTPSAAAGDLLIIGSGSGETASLIAKAKKAKRIGCRIGLVTISHDCSLGRLADHIIEIPAPTSKIHTVYDSIQPMGNLFEQSLLLVCDITVMRLMDKTGISSDGMFKNHANLE
ncbi:MAG TPA: 6-phospho-3-hexuloisomerase [Thermoanaerobacterales bacterium]|jgi:6-phospho-3-hexuloisomerase|nr:6-phospho-3-hexuloisomerase [Thermoanaerobacterales bacterium]